MKHLRIVFMGTPDFAVASLRALHASCHQVVGVITAPDRPAGRGRKLRPSPVKEFALQEGLPVLQPEKLKDPDFLKALAQWNADLQVVVAFRMLPEVVWAMPPLGTFNLHASLLPQYRGAAPINWAIMNGESETGVTTFYINQEIDTGSLLLQRSTPIGPQDTAGSLHDRLMAIGAELVVETSDLIAKGEARPRPQPSVDGLRNAPKIFREDCHLRWEQPAQGIHNHIRGLSPYPGAWAYLHNGETQQIVKVYRARISKEALTLAPGALVQENGKLYAGTSDGVLELLEIQLEGKKRMPVSDLLNGFQPEKNAQFR